MVAEKLQEPGPAVRCPVTDLQLLQSLLQNWVSSDQPHHLGTTAGPSSPPGAGRVAELLPTRICFGTFVIHQHAARAAFYLPNIIRQFLCFMNGYCRYHAGSLQHHAVTCSTRPRHV